MAKPLWKRIYAEMVETGDTIACEHRDEGDTYFMPKTGRMVARHVFNALQDRELLRPIPSLIDPEVPTAWEAIDGAA